MVFEVPRARNSWRMAAGIALILSAMATLLSLAAGDSLGLAIGGFFAAAILTPPLLSGWNETRDQAAILIGCNIGIGGVWLFMIGRAGATPGEWVELLAMLASFLILLGGVTLGLQSLRFSPVLGAMVTVILAIGWLTWPVWLSPGVFGNWLQRLVDVQPVLAANGVLSYTSPWTEQAIAYRLTALDQDVPIQLPGNSLLFIIFHAGIGLAIVGILMIKKKYRAKAAQPTA